MIGRISRRSSLFWNPYLRKNQKIGKKKHKKDIEIFLDLYKSGGMGETGSQERSGTL